MDPLITFAARHDGVVTTPIAESLGYSRSQLRTLVDHGGWHRLARAVYLAPDMADSLRARVRGVQLRHPALVASHRTAAALLTGATGATGAVPLDFTAPGPGRYDIDGTLYRWKATRADVVDLRGLAVTAPARTAADLLRAYPPHDAVIAVDTLLRERVTDPREVAAALHRARGTRYIRRAWTSYRRLDGRAGSPAESKARLVMEDAALRPRSQVVLVDRPGLRIRVDFWFAAGVAVEIEGFAHHASREQHAADVARFNALAQLRGVTVLRFSWADVFARGPAMVATIRAALTRAASAPTGGYVRHDAAYW